MMTAVIEVTGLTKQYGGQAVVDDISFHVDKGEIFGILGPNGAGKTTAVECMEGLRRRDGGEVRILGLTTWGEQGQVGGAALVQTAVVDQAGELP